jgi:hypothetical protein
MRLRHYAGFPGHWIEFEGRSSGISGTPRHATHPINAILNYGYSMLAGQVERKAVTRGLDVAWAACMPTPTAGLLSCTTSSNRCGRCLTGKCSGGLRAFAGAVLTSW